MSPVIRKFAENTDHNRAMALMAFRCAKSGEEWMHEFRWYRVTSVMREGDEVVIRGHLIREGRNHPHLKGATFSDTVDDLA